MTKKKMRVQIAVMSILIMALFLSVNAQPVEIIVETNVGGKNTQFYKELSGKWYDSEAKSTAAGCTPNIKSRFCDVDDKTFASARFQPEIPAEGEYEISVTWGRSANCNKAKYIIHIERGEKVAYLVQDGWGGLAASNANMWHSLGVFPLKAGTVNYVDITDEENLGKPDARNLGRLYCDAMKFSLAKTGLPTATITPAMPPAIPTPGFVILTPTPEFIMPTPTAIAPVSPAQIPWLDNVLYAQQLAQQQAKEIFLYFYADAATECQRYENETFKDISVANYIKEKFIPLKFNMTSRPSEAYYLGAYRAPTIILYRSDGTPYRRIIGFKTPTELLTLIR